MSDTLHLCESKRKDINQWIPTINTFLKISMNYGILGQENYKLIQKLGMKQNQWMPMIFVQAWVIILTIICNVSLHIQEKMIKLLWAYIDIWKQNTITNECPCAIERLEHIIACFKTFNNAKSMFNIDKLNATKHDSMSCHIFAKPTMFVFLFLLFLCVFFFFFSFIFFGF